MRIQLSNHCENNDLFNYKTISITYSQGCEIRGCVRVTLKGRGCFVFGEIWYSTTEKKKKLQRW